jgi:hypothetical protein
MDGAYSARYLAVAKTLWDASEGEPSRIPSNYADHLRHEYRDGDISLAHLLPKFEHVEGLEDFEVEEAIEMLGKVHPEDWPYPGEVESVDVEELLKIYDEDASSFDFAETPGTTSEKAELVLRHAIESVFGDTVDKVRSSSGDYPDVENGYLQEPDGSYRGSFEYDGKKFDFQIEPDESGWSVQYRMQAKSLDNLPPITDMDNQEEESSRNKGWR